MPVSTDPCVNVLGVGISAIDMSQAVQACEKLLTAGRGYVCVTGVHGVMEAQANPQFRSVLNSSFLTTPDGMPMVWLGRMQGHRGMRRVYGPDFMIELCRWSVSHGYRHFLYGGKKGVADELAKCLRERIPGVQIVGTFTPPFGPLSDQEQLELKLQVAACKPDIFWVGLSTPKQERFMSQYLDLLDTKLMIGVGAAFDIHTGHVKDAPRWIKNSGLQWFHRLCQEPRRLWRRYLINNPKFVLRIALQMAGITRYSL